MNQQSLGSLNLDVPAVLSEYSNLIWVYKPAGMTVIPTSYESSAGQTDNRTTEGLDEPSDVPSVHKVSESLRSFVEQKTGRKVWVLHRIDRMTSGLVVFAANAEAHRKYSMEFEKGTVEKIYAFASVLTINDQMSGSGLGADGEIKNPAFTLDRIKKAISSGEKFRIDVPLKILRKKTVAVPTGEKASPSKTYIQFTSFTEVGERRSDEANLANQNRSAKLICVTGLAFPKTGRKHQIRVHLGHVGLPIINDPIYGPPDAPSDGLYKDHLNPKWNAVKSSKMCLFASSIKFSDGQAFTLSVPNFFGHVDLGTTD